MHERGRTTKLRERETQRQQVIHRDIKRDRDSYRVTEGENERVSERNNE